MEKYDPPYTAEQIAQIYGPALLVQLQECPAHSWRMETGIELIHPEPSKEEQNRIWKNWTLMDEVNKTISDLKSFELFGCSNHEHHNRLMTSS